MKKIGIGILVALMLGCRIAEIGTDETKIDYTLKIVNKSGHDIQIEAFVLGKKYDVISIKNNEYYSKKKEYYIAPHGKGTPRANQRQNPYIFSEEFYGGRDSIIIKFSDKKYLYQNYDSINEDKNSLYKLPFKNSHFFDYYYKPKAKTSCYGTYEYRFTKEDYENAKDL